jgi:transposase
MPNFYEYNPEQGYLLPPSVRDVLGKEHLCFFVHGAVEKMDLAAFEASYSEEGHPAYHPALLLKVWLYAYALGSPVRGGWSSGFGKIWHFGIWRAERSRIFGR